MHDILNKCIYLLNSDVIMNLLSFVEPFLAVADQKSFTRAAEQLGITKGAISQAIRQLETLLKVTLFFRTTRSVQLSEEGKIFYQQCQRLKNEMEVTFDLVQQFHEAPQGKLRISCNPYYAKSKLPALIREYMKRFPEVKLELICDERLPDMAAEQIDVVFGINWPAPDDVVAKVIAHTRYVLCASPGYLAQYGIPKQPEDLKKHRYFPHMGRDLIRPVMYIEELLANDLNIKLAANNIQVMQSLAEAGLGIIQVHDYVVQDALAEGKLVEILSSHSQPDVPLYVYYQKHRFVQPKIRQFINLLDL